MACKFETVEAVPCWAAQYFIYGEEGAAEFTADDWEEVRRFERKLKEDGLRLVAPIDGTRDEFNPCPAFGYASATEDWTAERTESEVAK